LRVKLSAVSYQLSDQRAAGFIPSDF